MKAVDRRTEQVERLIIDSVVLERGIHPELEASYSNNGATADFYHTVRGIARRQAEFEFSINNKNNVRFSTAKNNGRESRN